MRPTTISSSVHRGVRWQTASRSTPPAMHHLVARLFGYDERTDGHQRRDELPGATVPIIIELGPGIRVEGLERRAGQAVAGGFAAGLSLAPTRTAHDGWQRGIQLDLRPTAAARLLGVPLKELRGQTVPLAHLSAARDVARRAHCEADWDQHLDAVEQWLAARLHASDPVDGRMVWAEDKLITHGGQLPIRSLWRELGMSERHFITRFTRTVGMTPKRYARLCRFDRICAALRTGPRSMAQLALDVGCFDQAHLHRETRALAGLTPQALQDVLAPP